MTLNRVRSFIDQYRSRYGKTPAVIELQRDEYEQLVADVGAMLIPKKKEPFRPTAAFGVPIKIVENHVIHR